LHTPHIERIALDSSTLASAGYLERTSTLEVEFRNGAVYRYFAVPPGVFEALLAAESKGAYFGRFIRNHFPYARDE
jgi:hypothetical protein